MSDMPTFELTDEQLVKGFNDLLAKTLAHPGLDLMDTTLERRENGRLVFDGIVVGEQSDGQITLNLGWCRCANLKVRILADPEVDRSRSGVLLERG